MFIGRNCIGSNIEILCYYITKEIKIKIREIVMKLILNFNLFLTFLYNAEMKYKYKEENIMLKCCFNK